MCPICETSGKWLPPANCSVEMETAESTITFWPFNPCKTTVFSGELMTMAGFVNHWLSLARIHSLIVTRAYGITRFSALFWSHLLCLIYFIRLPNTRQLREGLSCGYGGIELHRPSGRSAISTSPKFLTGVIILRSVVFVCTTLRLACVGSSIGSLFSHSLSLSNISK